MQNKAFYIKSFANWNILLYICPDKSLFSIMKKILFALTAALTLVSCTSKKTDETSDLTRSLIVYYSQNHTTQQVANLLHAKTTADMEELLLENPYVGDLGQTAARCQQEAAEGVLPALKPLQVDVANYDTIYLGYPIWFGTYAPPIAAFLKNADLTGKVIVPFCTFGSGGLNTSTDQLKAALPQSVVLPGYGVRAARLEAANTELDRFLIEIGVAEGEIEMYSDYVDLPEMTEADAEIFEQACGSYPMPLGNPIAVARRTTSESMDYCFTVESKNPAGETTQAQIFVVVPNDTTKTPEFVQVVR